MQSRFTKKAQEALDHAAETAAMLGHGYIGSEHLLIGLIQAEDTPDPKPTDDTNKN